MQFKNVNYNKPVSRFLSMKSTADKPAQKNENTGQSQNAFISLPKPVFPKNGEKALNILPTIFSFLSLIGVGYLLLTNRSKPKIAEQLSSPVQKNIQALGERIDDLGNTVKSIMVGMHEKNAKIDELGAVVKNIAVETKNNAELTRQVKGAADYACGRVDHVAYMSGKISQDVSTGFNNAVERLGSKIEDVQGMVFKSKGVEEGMKDNVRQLCKIK